MSGPAKRSGWSSWNRGAHSPDGSICAKAGTPSSIVVTRARVTINANLIVTLLNQMPMGQWAKCQMPYRSVFYMTFGIWPIDPLAFGSPDLSPEGPFTLAESALE